MIFKWNVCDSGCSTSYYKSCGAIVYYRNNKMDHLISSKNPKILFVARTFFFLLLSFCASPFDLAVFFYLGCFCHHLSMEMQVISRRELLERVSFFLFGWRVPFDGTNVKNARVYVINSYACCRWIVNINHFQRHHLSWHERFSYHSIWFG